MPSSSGSDLLQSAGAPAPCISDPSLPYSPCLPILPCIFDPSFPDPPCFPLPTEYAPPLPSPAASPPSPSAWYYYGPPPAAADNDVAPAPQHHDYGAAPVTSTSVLSHSRHSIVWLVVGVVVVVVLIVLILACWLYRRRKKPGSWRTGTGAEKDDNAAVTTVPMALDDQEAAVQVTNRPTTFPSPDPSDAVEQYYSVSVRGPRRFTYTQLAAATDNFHKSNLLGRGGFGPVYKGLLDDGSFVAVKCIGENSRQGIKEFMAEVTIISDIRHRNLVKLKGWCEDSEHMNSLFLIYDYLRNGSLDTMLFDDERCGDLTWRRRFGIAMGLGSALQYLHDECETAIIHRDVKSSNVLLDENFVAKLGDFGLSRRLAEEAEGHTTIVAGTIGYLAPEVHQTGRCTRESDIFSFGIVLAELATGRRARDLSKPPDSCLVVDWVRRLHEQGQLLQAADWRLAGDFDVSEMERLLLLALSCAQHHPWRRPSARDALHSLQGTFLCLQEEEET